MSEEAYYPISALQLFRTFDRASYEKEFNVQAPPFDPVFPPKKWSADFPGSAPVVEYDAWSDKEKAFVKISITRKQAALVNLPGPYIYPKWVVAPTSAVTVDPRSLVQDPANPGGDLIHPTSTVNPAILCTREQADEVSEAINGDSVVEWGYPEASPFRYDWRGETRRYWAIRKGGQFHSAALLLRKMYADGVDNPGHFEEKSGEFTWVSDNLPTNNGMMSVPVPSRLLNDNEAIYVNPFQTIVYRTDMESPYNPKPGTGDGFPPDLRLTIERIDANLQMLIAMGMGGPMG